MFNLVWFVKKWFMFLLNAAPGMLVRMLHVVAMLAAANVSKESFRSYGKGVIWQSHCVTCSMSQNRLPPLNVQKDGNERSIFKTTHTLMTFIPKALGSTRLLHLSFSKAKFFRLNSQEPRPRLFRTHVRPTAGFWTECTTMLFCSMLKASKGYRLYLCHLMPHVNLKSSKLIWKLVCVYIRSAVGSSWKSRDMQLSYRCGQRMVKGKFQDRLMIN